ncbi:hypothetical protein Tco_1564694, partial [Tanacetum coccineum]
MPELGLGVKPEARITCFLSYTQGSEGPVYRTSRGSLNSLEDTRIYFNSGVDNRFYMARNIKITMSSLRVECKRSFIIGLPNAFYMDQLARAASQILLEALRGDLKYEKKHVWVRRRAVSDPTNQLLLENMSYVYIGVVKIAQHFLLSSSAEPGSSLEVVISLEDQSSW